MKLQRIIAKDSRTANEQAIAQYGRDVLVVSNSRVNGMTELIVAVDVQPEASPRPVLRPGAAQAFEATLQSQFRQAEARGDGRADPQPSGAAMSPSMHSTSSAAAMSASAAASAASPASAAAEGEGFMPAHLALMRSAQRAAAAIDPAVAAQQAASPSIPSAPASTATRKAGAPSLRYGHQYSFNGTGLAGSLPMGLSWGTTLDLGSRPSAAMAGAQGESSAAADAPSDASDIHRDSPVGTAATSTSATSAADTPSAVDARSAVELIRRELAELRREVRIGQQLQSWSAQGPAHRRNEALAEVGAPTLLRALLVSGLSNDHDDAQALESIEAQMRENLPAPVRRSGSRGASATGALAAGSAQAALPWRAGAHLISGPSGAGKTSMAARLAQEAAARLGVEQVILVGWNDNRPGAWGQLQLWASRIGVAAYRAADTATLDMLMQEHRGRLLIIDSGLSQPDILKAACGALSVHHHLVMPADATAATLRRWIGEHAPSWADLMVTRLDESAQSWPLLQACCEHRLHPVAASDGSGIPHLRLPYDAPALLQHAMGQLAATLGAGAHGEDGATGRSLEIPTIDRITTTVPTRQAGRSGRSSSNSSATTRRGASHA